MATSSLPARLSGSTSGALRSPSAGGSTDLVRRRSRALRAATTTSRPTPGDRARRHLRRFGGPHADRSDRGHAESVHRGAVTQVCASLAQVSGSVPAPAMLRIVSGTGGGGAGRSPSGRGHTIGVHATVDRRADGDAVAVDAQVPGVVAAGAAVGDVDHRVHGAVVVGDVRLRHVHGEAVVERDRALRHFDEDRLDGARPRAGPSTPTRPRPGRC